MSELAGLNSLLVQLWDRGFHSSAIATFYNGHTEYLAWYKMDAFVEQPELLKHLGALVRQMHDKDTDQPKTELNLGEPNRIIIEIAGITFRHLTLEEQVRFQEGYSNPRENLDPAAYYDHVNGKPLN